MSEKYILAVKSLMEWHAIKYMPYFKANHSVIDDCFSWGRGEDKANPTLRILFEYSEDTLQELKELGFTIEIKNKKIKLK